MKPFIAIFILLLVFSCAVSAFGAEMLSDGEYTIEAILNGGSGRAYVESPAMMTVKNGVCTATVIWSSSSYKYMRIGDATYEPVQGNGNSTFEIPVKLDENIVVHALTVAMGEPHEIEYTLRFDSSTMQSADKGVSVFICAAAVCAVVLIAGATVIVVRKRRNRGEAR